MDRAAHGHLADQPQDAPGELAVIEFVNRTAEADIARAHTDFVANASHELRTPLASIIGYTETLREDVESLEPTMADKFLGTIQREAKRLQELVSDLMSLSDRCGARPAWPTLGLLRNVQRDAANGHAAELLDFEAAGEFTVAGPPATGTAGASVDNGFKYGASGEPVTVRIHPKGQGRLRLTVSDRGEGISPDTFRT